MRRLWANIIIAFTVLFAVFASVPGVVKGLSTNGDYKTRREFTFQLSEKDITDGEATPAKLDDDSAKNMAKIMEERLINSGITSYEISTSGKDIVKVAFATDSLTSYQQITTYLCFSGSFALMSEDPDGEPLLGKDFLSGNAYLKDFTVNEYPTLIIPVDTSSEAYKAIIDYAQNHKQSQSSSDSEEETTETAPVYLIYNYVTGDTYKTLNDSGKFAEKRLITLDASTDETLYYDGSKNAFAQIIGYSDDNGNGYADENEVRTAYQRANFFYNIFNASALDFDVEVIRGLSDETYTPLPATIESLFVNTKISFTSTMVAVLVAALLITLLLITFYRLGAMNAATTTALTVFLSFLIFSVTGLEFNTLAVVGLLTVGLISVVSTVIHLNKLKEECYRGRTIRKANSEASRKSTLPVVDIHVIAAIIALMFYLLGGTAFHSFAAITLLGTLISVILNTIGFKLLMWLATNTTALTNKYFVFGIEEEHVANHMEDEKQKYFGSQADKEFTKKFKPVSIVAISLFVLSVIGIGLSAGLNNGNLLKKTSSKISGSEIYVVDTIRVIDDEKTKLVESGVTDMLKGIKLYSNAGETVAFDENDKHQTLYELVDTTTIKNFETTETKNNDEGEKNYLTTYYTLSLSSYLDGNSIYARAQGYDTEDRTLNQLLEIYFDEINRDFASSYKTTIDLKTVETYVNAASAKWESTLLALSIAILVSTVYLLIRYRLSRGLSSLIYPVVTSAITLGIVVLIGLITPIDSIVFVAAPITALFSYFFVILINNKERDLIVDSKVRNIELDQRLELADKANKMAATPILAISGMLVFGLITFFGFGPAASYYVYLALLIGLGISLALVLFTYLPISNWFLNKFSNVKIKPITKKSKKNIVTTQKSAEPEEAIFIGIND